MAVGNFLRRMPGHSIGREGGVLYRSTHNGIWCFTRGWEMDETLRIIMDIKRLKERKERGEL